MALLDDILGGVLGQLGGRADQPGTGKALLGKATQFLQGCPGALPSRIGADANAGYGCQARSWVTTGQNLPITPEQIFQVVGQGRVQSMGQQVGLAPQDASAGLSGHLPVLMAQLTPRRRAPAHRRAR